MSQQQFIPGKNDYNILNHMLSNMTKYNYLDKFNEHNKGFINDLEKQEELEDRIETIDSINNDIKATKQNTELKKEQFINELKSGLGQKVKNNPNRVKIIKKKWHQKLITAIKNIFIKYLLVFNKVLRHRQ